MIKRYTEKDLENIINKKVIIKTSVGIINPVNLIPNINNQNKENNQNLKISLESSKFKKTSIKKIILPNEDKPKKNSPINIYLINKTNKESIIHNNYSDKHFCLAFEGAKLLSINQIFAFLQNPKLKFSFFSYKKNWHDMIKNILYGLELEAKKQNKKLPFFNDSVELTVFRQAPKLVDEDALTTMFKFIIDALKRTKDNPYGILAEDNPKIVHKINCYSEKGKLSVGIKIKLIEGQKKEFYDIKKLLEN